jgi:sarcosine oxidase subunit alpha
VTEQFAQFAIAGPRSRDVLGRLLPHCDVSDAALPHLGILQTELDGTPVIVYRMSYSGERAYEIAVGSDCGEALWTRILECGEAFGITPYGTEAMGVLRIEKGHVTGNELDGRTTAADVGMGRLVRKGGGFVGAALLARDGLNDPARPVLVGLVPVDGKSAIRTGSHLVAEKGSGSGTAAKGSGSSTQPGRPDLQRTRIESDPFSAPRSEPDPISSLSAKLGVVTSATPSAFLGHPIALALLANGNARHGDEIVAASPLSAEFVRVKVGPPVFVDPGHARMKA